MRKALHATMVVAVSALCMTGCDNGSSGKTAGQQLDAAIARTEKAGGQTLAKTRELASDARSQIQSGEVGQKLKETRDSISSTVEDTATTARIHAILINDAETRLLQIQVDTRGGNVRLEGNVPNLNASQRAEQLARSVSGVVKIDNRLIVGSS